MATDFDTCYVNPYLTSQYCNNGMTNNTRFTETAGSPAFRGQPETDVYERSSGPGVVGVAGTTAAGAAAGAGIGWINNPVKDLKAQTLNPDIYKVWDKLSLADEIEIAQNRMKQNKGYNLAQLAKAESFDALPDEVKDFLKKNKFSKLTPEQAKGLIEAAGKKVEDFDLNKVAQNVTERYATTSAVYYDNLLKKLTPEEIKAIENAKNADELKVLVTKHKEALGIKGTEEEVAKQIDGLVAKGNKEVATIANKQVTAAKAELTKVNTEIFKGIDSKTGKILESSDEFMNKLFKEFKWQQVKKFGKWGAAIAGAGALIYSLFSGSSGKQQV